MIEPTGHATHFIPERATGHLEHLRGLKHIPAGFGQGRLNKHFFVKIGSFLKAQIFCHERPVRRLLVITQVLGYLVRQVIREEERSLMHYADTLDSILNL